MLPLLTSAQVAECIAFENINPQGQSRSDARAALIAWSVTRTGYRGNPKAKIGDFFLKFFRDPPKSVNQMREAMKAFATKFKRKPNG